MPLPQEAQNGKREQLTLLSEIVECQRKVCASPYHPTHEKESAMFRNNTFVAAHKSAREFAADLTAHLVHIGERHTLHAVLEFECGIRIALKELNEEVHLVIRDESNLVMWTCLLGACHDNLRTISMNLRFWGEPEWNWKEVIEATSFIAAVVENTSTMIGEQTPPPTTAVTS
jgi:hypothetical protein